MTVAEALSFAGVHPRSLLTTALVLAALVIAVYATAGAVIARRPGSIIASLVVLWLTIAPITYLLGFAYALSFPSEPAILAHGAALFTASVAGSLTWIAILSTLRLPRIGPVYVSAVILFVAGVIPIVMIASAAYVEAMAYTYP